MKLNNKHNGQQNSINKLYKIIKLIIGIKNKSQGPDPSLALKSPTMKAEILMKACEQYKWKYTLYLQNRRSNIIKGSYSTKQSVSTTQIYQ